MTAEVMVRHDGGCHCGQVRFEVLAPDGFSVNARCIDPGTITRMNITQVNGRDWEKNFLRVAGDTSNA